MAIAAVQSQLESQFGSQINLVMGFFKRNKPIEMIMMQSLNAIYFLVTLQTRMKLNKYKYLLAVEKLEKMQQSLSESYQPTNSCGRLNALK